MNPLPDNKEKRDAYAAMSDGEKLIAWLEEAADELRGAHVFLDYRGVPKAGPNGEGVTLAWRIGWLAESSLDVPREAH